MKLITVILVSIIRGLVDVVKHIEPLYKLDLDFAPFSNENPIDTNSKPSPVEVFADTASAPPDPIGEMVASASQEPPTPPPPPPPPPPPLQVLETPPATPPLPPAQTPGSSVELDSEGLPWDKRIHSGSRGKLAKTGAWKLIRGIEKKSPGLVEQVKAELKQTMAIPAPSAVGTPPAQALETPPATPPLPPAQPQLTSVARITTLAELMAAATTGGKTPDEMTEACNAVGLSSAQLLVQRPDLIPSVVKALRL